MSFHGSCIIPQKTQKIISNTVRGEDMYPGLTLLSLPRRRKPSCDTIKICNGCVNHSCFYCNENTRQLFWRRIYFINESDGLSQLWVGKCGASAESTAVDQEAKCARQEGSRSLSQPSVAWPSEPVLLAMSQFLKLPWFQKFHQLENKYPNHDPVEDISSSNHNTE